MMHERSESLHCQIAFQVVLAISISVDVFSIIYLSIVNKHGYKNV